MGDSRSRQFRSRQGPRPKSVRALAKMLDGQEMLDELASGQDGTVLVTIFQAIKGWAVSISLNGVLAQQCTVPAMLAEVDAWKSIDLKPVIDALTNNSIIQASREIVGGACIRISTVASENNLFVTQFCFAAAAGLCVPSDPIQALEVGRLARQLARWSDAEVWLEHSIAVAKQKKNREIQALAILSLGNMFYRQGLYHRAKSAFLEALSLSRQYELCEYRGRALHDMFVILVELGDVASAEVYAREALVAYGASHPSVPTLAYDVAYVWLIEGYSARALAVFQAILPYIDHYRPEVRVNVLACTARAAAEIGDRAKFLKFVRDVREICGEPQAQGAIAASLATTALGAISLGELSLANELLHDSNKIAFKRGELDVIARVDDLFGRIESDTLMPATSVTMRVDHSSGTDNAPDDFVEALVRSLVVKNVVDLENSFKERVLYRASDILDPACQCPILPSSLAQGSHCSFIRDVGALQVSGYKTFCPSSGIGGTDWLQTLHFHLDGNPSFNRATRTDVVPPHVHDPSVPGGVRAALPHEIPARPW